MAVFRYYSWFCIEESSLLVGSLLLGDNMALCRNKDPITPELSQSGSIQDSCLKHGSFFGKG